MSLIIDGHNLIGVLPGIALGEPEDEVRLLERLRGYRLRQGGQPMIVFFDSGDLPANRGDLSTSGLQVRFSGPGETADDAIIAFLQSRSQPGQYAVVTNDQGLQYRARMAGASTLAASSFAARLTPSRRHPPAASAPPPGPDPHDPAFADLYDRFLQTERGGKRHKPASADEIAAWAEQLYSDDIPAACGAAERLGLFGGRDGLEPLRDGLTHTDARVRAAACLALGDLDEPAAGADLSDRLLHDRASMVRQAAAQALGHAGDRSSMPALEQAASSDTKGKVRKAAQTALAQIRARHS